MRLPGREISQQVADLLADPPVLAGEEPLWQQNDRQLVESAEEILSLSRGVQVALWRQLDAMARREGSRRAIDITAEWLIPRSGLLADDARAAVRLAIRMCANPTILAAYADGEIGEREAKYIVDYIAQPPRDMYKKRPADGGGPDADAEDAGSDAGETLVPMDEEERSEVRGAVRDFLLLAAGTRNMDTLRSAGKELRNVLSREADPGLDLDRNTFEIIKFNDGRIDLRGNLDTETGENLFAALSPFMLDRPEYDGSPDQRCLAQKRADAFSELLRRNRPAAEGQVEKGLAPRINVNIPIELLFGRIPTHAERCQMIREGRIEELLEHTSRGWMQWMGSISLAAAQRLACDCELVMIGADENGAPLCVETNQRFANEKHRIALADRDRGCAFPNCNRPAAWTQAHHMIPWAIRQSTHIDGLCNLCTYHHVAVHHHGWTVMLGRKRFPIFRPPAKIDPLRRWLNSDGSYVEDPPGLESDGVDPPDALRDEAA